MTDHVQVAHDGHVLTVRFARTDKRNAITADMYSALTEAVEGAERDHSVRAVVFLGSGGHFTAGNDIADFLERPPLEPTAPVFGFLEALARASVPMVAGVEGNAVGIGTTMLLHCDIVLITTDARMRLPFVDLGLVPEAASSLLLPRLVGHARAAELLMLAETFDGARAVELGIANRIVGASELEAEAMSVAARIAEKPPRAMRETRRLMRADRDLLEATIRREAELFGELLRSPEAREAFSAFLEKRKPDFSRTT